ncbi:hypothetical protein PAXRUDRAFT_831172 [Paxillus rubicundulus Ve08.2h10]|uniref:Uncharacterized protein n=1 Tax=Paxillus rubicundulus Ve08.2h10 TaxID=930991 RepID=A0A0D0DSF4_9AGAM|nr:hypothetical protein PAXRUDRAFT_831172 [Paxillus rubicundulus Ve08.2h10]
MGLALHLVSTLRGMADFLLLTEHVASASPNALHLLARIVCQMIHRRSMAARA